MEMLLATLRISKKTEDEHDVVKRLADLCQRHPIESVECLWLIIDGDKEGWILPLVENEARGVLSVAMNSNIPQASLAARRLIQDLIRRGHYEFRTLLG